MPARIGIGFDLFQDLSDLVDVCSIGRRPGTPLMSVNRAEIAILVGPLVPDRHAVFLQVAGICVAVEKPQKFMNDRTQMQFFGGQQGEANA